MRAHLVRGHARMLQYWTGSSVAETLYVTQQPQSPSVMDVGPEPNHCDKPQFVPLGFKHLNKETWVVSKDLNKGEYLYYV